MTAPTFTIRPETKADSALVLNLAKLAFGPGMTARAAYALREDVAHCEEFSFVAIDSGELIGSVRMTPILWGEGEILMLGPLCVRPDREKRGIGRTLMKTAVDAAREKAGGQGGHDMIFLVGDLAYYEPFGFRRIPPGQISLPRPADPARVLGCELISGALLRYSGQARRLSESNTPTS